MKNMQTIVLEELSAIIENSEDKQGIKSGVVAVLDEAYANEGRLFARTPTGIILAELNYHFNRTGSSTMDFRLFFGNFELVWILLKPADLQSYRELQLILREILTVGQLRPVEITNTHRVWRYDCSAHKLVFDRGQSLSTEAFIRQYVVPGTTVKPAEPATDGADDDKDNDEKPDPADDDKDHDEKNSDERPE